MIWKKIFPVEAELITTLWGLFLENSLASARMGIRKLLAVATRKVSALEGEKPNGNASAAIKVAEKNRILFWNKGVVIKKTKIQTG